MKVIYLSVVQCHPPPPPSPPPLREGNLQWLTWHGDMEAQWGHDRIMYNDCLYRNIHTYTHIAVLDIDEVMSSCNHENLETFQYGVS